jgi:hypothetical protein
MQDLPQELHVLTRVDFDGSFGKSHGLLSDQSQHGAPRPGAIRICDESSEVSAEPRMTGHQEYCFLRFVRLAQGEQNDAVRFPGFRFNRQEPSRPRRHDEQEQIRNLRWLGEKVMKDQFVDGSLQFCGTLEYAADVAFDAGGDETADTVKT